MGEYELRRPYISTATGEYLSLTSATLANATCSCPSVDHQTSNQALTAGISNRRWRVTRLRRESTCSRRASSAAKAASHSARACFEIAGKARAKAAVERRRMANEWENTEKEELAGCELVMEVAAAREPRAAAVAAVTPI